MSLEDLVESQIQDAIAAGAFDNLPGAGKPLPPTDGERLAGENWLGFKVLQNGGMLPEWLGLAREIERDRDELRRIDALHAELVEAGAATGDWPRFAPGILYAEKCYEERARLLRPKQDRYNMGAPGIRSERPGIWVEFHMERLRQRASAAGAPGTLSR
jgi:hypothetical protein